MSGYVFMHFTGDGPGLEQISMSLSRDGLHWKDVNQGRPILISQLGTKGARDPFLVRHPETGVYYLIATDLQIAAGHGWTAAVLEGSKDVLVWQSEDLIHWSPERSVTVGVEGAGCVWAPEAVYDYEKGAFLMFWASHVTLNGEAAGRHRIFGAYTEDFQTFTQPFLFMEKEMDVIDSTIVEEAGRFYRFTKDETNKRILLESSDALTGKYEKVAAQVLEDLPGVEGPECYLLPDQKTWCLIVDRFAEHKGYLPILIHDLTTGTMEILGEDAYDLGMSKKRHGGVLAVDEDTITRLEEYYEV